MAHQISELPDVNHLYVLQNHEDFHEAFSPALMQAIEWAVERLRWQPIETAPVQMDPILMTDGKWFAAGHVDPDGSRKFPIYHFAVCQEYDWTPTHWMPLPGAPQTTEATHEFAPPADPTPPVQLVKGVCSICKKEFEGHPGDNACHPCWLGYDGMTAEELMGTSQPGDEQ